MMYVVCTTIQNDDIAVGVSTAAYNAPQTTEIQHFWAWADKLGIWGYFRPNYQHPFWYSGTLVHVFHLIQPLILQKK